VQTAVKLVIEPIFEADLEPNAYGYRPGRSAGDAVEAVHALLRRGHTDVVDADLSKYFDTIPHDQLVRASTPVFAGYAVGCAPDRRQRHLEAD